MDDAARTDTGRRRRRGRWGRWNHGAAGSSPRKGTGNQRLRTVGTMGTVIPASR